jgi:hypothetical protein
MTLSTPAPTPAPTLPATRNLFTAAIALAATAGISLYVFTAQTDRLFAWTIASPLTAAFLGALYLGDIPLLLAVRREPVWAYARAAAWGLLLFTGFSLVATVLHLDKFHLGAGPASATLAGWLWMAVYISLPLTGAWLIWRQSRVGGGDPPALQPWGAAGRRLHWALAAAALALGLILLLAPGLNAWPWALTPLTSRAVSARVLAFAGVAFLGARAGDARGQRAAQGSLLVRGALALGALLRYPSELDLTSAGGLLFTGLCLLAIAAGARGLMNSKPA